MDLDNELALLFGSSSARTSLVREPSFKELLEEREFLERDSIENNLENPEFPWAPRASLVVREDGRPDTVLVTGNGWEPRESTGFVLADVESYTRGSGGSYFYLDFKLPSSVLKMMDDHIMNKVFFTNFVDGGFVAEGVPVLPTKHFRVWTRRPGDLKTLPAPQINVGTMDKPWIEQPPEFEMNHAKTAAEAGGVAFGARDQEAKAARRSAKLNAVDRPREWQGLEDEPGFAQSEGKLTAVAEEEGEEVNVGRDKLGDGAKLPHFPFPYVRVALTVRTHIQFRNTCKIQNPI